MSLIRKIYGAWSWWYVLGHTMACLCPMLSYSLRQQVLIGMFLIFTIAQLFILEYYKVCSCYSLGLC